MRKVRGLKTTSKWLVTLGAINWGLIALVRYDVFMAVLGQWPLLLKWVYILVGAAGVWGAYAMLTNSKKK